MKRFRGPLLLTCCIFALFLFSSCTDQSEEILGKLSEDFRKAAVTCAEQLEDGENYKAVSAAEDGTSVTFRVDENQWERATVDEFTLTWDPQKGAVSSVEICGLGELASSMLATNDWLFLLRSVIPEKDVPKALIEIEVSKFLSGALEEKLYCDGKYSLRYEGTKDRCCFTGELVK